MANGKITRQEVVEDKVLNIGKDYATSLQPAIDANEAWLRTFAPIKAAALEMANLEKEFKASKGRKEFLELKKKEQTLSAETAKALKAEQAALLQLQKVESEKLRTDKLALDIEAKKQRAKNQTVKKTIEEREAEKALNKIKREQAKVTLGLLTPYQKLSKQLDKARLEAKDLGVQFGQNSKQFKAAQKEVAALDNRLKSLDRALGQSQRYVGEYERSLKGLRGIFLNLTSALGFTGGLFAFVQVMRNSIGIIRDFEKANATLSGILQVEKEDMQDLEADAKRLGETTVKTASEVTQLQIAYARLGFAQDDIINLTEATIQGSIALNSELDATATLAGAVVNTFDDLSTSDAPKILDTLSLATAKSALDFAKLETGIPIVAGAANAAGVPFTKLIALMGKLSDAGIDISTSSTALRNIFIEAAAEGLNYEQILEKIKGSTDKLTASNDAFGKRAAVSAAVLANNIDKTAELDEVLQNAAGTAERMANKELDTLSGALDLLKSAWEGVVQGTADAGSVTDKIKVSIQFLARNLATILKTLATVIGSFIAYRIVLFSINGITAAYRLTVIALSAGKALLAANTTRATAAMRLFKIQLASTGVGAIVVAVGALAGAFFSLSDSVDDTTRSYKDMKKAADEATKSIVKNRIAIVENQLQQIDAEVDNQAEANRRKLALINQAIEDEKAGKSQQREAEQNFNEWLEDQQNDKVKKTDEINERLKQIEEEANQERYDAIKNRVRNERDEVIKGAQETARIQEKTLEEAGKVQEKAQSETIKKLQALRDKLTASLEKTEDEESEKQRKARLKREEKLQEDAYELAKFTIEERIRLTKEFIDDEENSFYERQATLEELAEEEIKLARLVAERKLNLTGTATDDEIQNLLNGIKLKRELSDEELLILKEFESQRSQIIADRDDDDASFDADRLQREAETRKNIREKAMNDELRMENELFQAKEGIYADQEKAVENRERRIAEIKKKYALEALNAQVVAVEKLLQSEELSADMRAKYEAELADIKREISDITTEKFLENDEEEVLSARRKYEVIADASYALTAAIADLANNISQQRIDNIDREIEKSNERFEKDLENENLSEEQRQELEEKKRAEEQRLQKERAKEMKKQAVLAKATTAFQISLNTTSAVLAALAPPPIGLGPVFGPIIAAATAATGAVQLAAALAEPIPAYFKGTDNHPGGLAEVSEVRPEVIEEPGKRPYIQKRRAILDLPKGTKVTPSVEEYERMMRVNMVYGVEGHTKKLNDFQARNEYGKYDKKVLSKLDNVTRAIKAQQHRLTINQQKAPDLNHELFRMNNKRWS